MASLEQLIEQQQVLVKDMLRNYDIIEAQGSWQNALAKLQTLNRQVCLEMFKPFFESGFAKSVVWQQLHEYSGTFYYHNLRNPVVNECYYLDFGIELADETPVKRPFERRFYAVYPCSYGMFKNIVNDYKHPIEVQVYEACKGLAWAMERLRNECGPNFYRVAFGRAVDVKVLAETIEVQYYDDGHSVYDAHDPLLTAKDFNF